MKRRLLWKLLLGSFLPVILVVITVIWLGIDHLAADYVVDLLEKYAISPTDIHANFLAAVHRYLLWTSLVALVVTTLLSFLRTQSIVQPLVGMAEITKRIAGGDFSGRVVVHARDEIGDLGQAFNRMVDRLAVVEQLRKNMLADVAHELRSPLTNLGGYLEALNDQVLPPTSAILQVLQEECLHLMRLVENLQQLAKDEAAEIALNPSQVIPSEEVARMLELYRQPFLDKGISVTLDQSSTLSLLADRDKILQVLRNLCENCLKFTPAGGWIEVSTADDGRQLTVAFRNSGPGIAADDLPFIFERFFRPDRSRPRQEGGFGIGLSIVKKLIEAQGGAVGAESNADWTTVWFALPLQSH